MKRKRHYLYAELALSLFIAATVMMLYRVEPFYTYYYFFAWWPYIIVVDTVIHLRTGRSLLRTQRRTFLSLAGWSAIIWFIFEFYNFFIKNWYYVAVEPARYIRWPAYVLAFATVLPGIFLTSQLFAAFGLFQKLRTRTFTLSPMALRLMVALGLMMSVAPFVLPGIFFPFVWGGLTLLLAPLNYRAGGDSLLRELAAGKVQRLLLLIAAGFTCGGLWELFNFWAGAKWIYTVPGLDDVKLFEMPLLGFLGFPVFAIECRVIYNFIKRIKKHPPLQGQLHIAAVLFSIIVMIGIDAETVSSYKPYLDRFPGVTRAEAAEFAAHHIITAADLRQAQADGVPLDLAPERLAELYQKAALALHKSMGAVYADLLYTAGITDVRELAYVDPETLYLRLQLLAPLHPEAVAKLRLAQVRVWVAAARNTG